MSKLTLKIVHLTSAHPRYDTRIFIKMCSSLASQYNDVSLVVADGIGDEVKNGVSILDVDAKTGGRFSRMTKTVKRVFEKAKVLDADIYHLHDPELIPIGKKLKKMGKKVIFDAHEDLPKQILHKPYLPIFLRLFLSKIFTFYEKGSLPKFDAIVAATPAIEEKFSSYHSNVVNINNYPILDEIRPSDSFEYKKNEICYIGGITRRRGIIELVESLCLVDDVKLNLAGRVGDKDLLSELSNSDCWNRVSYLGFLGRPEVAKTLNRSFAGVVTLHPVANYIDSLPVKMFEYLGAGIPVIASDFPLWKEIIEKNGCGLCVNPLEPKEIAKAITYLKNHESESKKMGERGRDVVEKKYNWAAEFEKMISLYSRL